MMSRKKARKRDGEEKKMEVKTERGVGGDREGERMGKCEKRAGRTYPCASGSSMFILVLPLFPKQLLVPYRLDSTYFQACWSTTRRLCESLLVLDWCFPG